MWNLQEEFSRVEIGEASCFENLAVFPLLRNDQEEESVGYILLEEGIASDQVRVSETDGGGCVSSLRIENGSELPLLLIDGEELIGAKQDRALNLSILVPAKSTLTIPVTCVEAGRWSAASPHVQTAGHLSYARLRGLKLEAVTRAMHASGSYKSNQSEVWKEIAAKSSRLNAASPTQATSAIHGRLAEHVARFAGAFAWRPSQCGIVFSINGRIRGMDLFAHATTMQRFFEKLVRSYSLDALDAHSGSAESVSRAGVDEFIGRVCRARIFTQQAVGLGKEIRVNGTRISGAALWAMERYLHVCAFEAAGESSGLNGRMTPPSQRGTL